MNKLIFALLFAAVIQLPLEARTIYVARHGQVDSKVRVSQTVRDLPLTDLGVKQAKALADFLVREKKFNGKIYVSPFYRTIQTGTYTAKLLNSKVILEPGIQEIAPGKKVSYSMNLKTIDSLFTGLTVPGKRFSDSWRVCAENAPMRNSRVEKAVEAILAEEKGDILLISHGGIIGPVNRAIMKKNSGKVKRPSGTAWNCALYIFELDEKDNVVKTAYTTQYMDDKELTSNFRTPKIPRPDDPRYENNPPKKGKAKK